MTGLYIHVPFCSKKCHYCNFVIAAGEGAEGRGRFLEALEREASRRSSSVAGAFLETVYLGGGTPSLLDEGEIERLFGILRAHFHWAENAEVTCEANPGDIGPSKARLWKKLGVNRVSLGAQSFHDETLKALNRTHSTQDTVDSFKTLREAGFDNISMDLILSLPKESWPSAKVSLERLAALGPEHVSLYELAIEDKTVFGDLKKRGRLALPDEDEQMESLSKARAFLKGAGYDHYELLSYAKEGRRSRHNLLYWKNEDTLGLGPGAYSYVSGRRTRHSESYRQYLEKVSAGDWAPIEDEALAGEKKETESFLLALRLSEGAPLERFSATAGRLDREIRGLSEKGLLESDGRRIRLTERGQFLAETVFAELSC